MTRYLVSFAVIAVLAGCAATSLAPSDLDMSAARASGQLRPVARPETLDTALRPVPAAARTVEQFDTTTTQERQEAITKAVNARGETALGTTVASLGSPGEPGFWLKTPLVPAPAKGRVVYPGTGKSVAVDLIPLDGPKTAGSRLSLAAMRLIEAPLTGLPEVQVFEVER